MLFHFIIFVSNIIIWIQCIFLVRESNNEPMNECALLLISGEYSQLIAIDFLNALHMIWFYGISFVFVYIPKCQWIFLSSEYVRNIERYRCFAEWQKQTWNGKNEFMWLNQPHKILFTEYIPYITIFHGFFLSFYVPALPLSLTLFLCRMIPLSALHFVLLRSHIAIPSHIQTPRT